MDNPPLHRNIEPPSVWSKGIKSFITKKREEIEEIEREKEKKKKKKKGKRMNSLIFFFFILGTKRATLRGQGERGKVKKKI